MNTLEAKSLLENELFRYRKLSYAELLSLLDRPETFERFLQPARFIKLKSKSSLTKIPGGIRCVLTERSMMEDGMQLAQSVMISSSRRTVRLSVSEAEHARLTIK